MTFALIAARALGFLKALPWQAYALLAAVVAVLLLWHVHTAQKRAYYNEAYNAGYTSLRKGYDIQAQSIVTLQAEIVKQNADADSRAKAYADSKAGNAQDQKTNNAKQAADKSRLDMLKAIKKQAEANPSCAASHVLISQLEGL